jgi:hypothetical protein
MMESWIAWLNTNSAAVQSLSTIVLVCITAWYAIRTHQLTSITQKQLELVRKAHEPDLIVTSSGALVPVPGGDLITAFSLSAANRGHLPVTVDVPYFRLPDGKTMVFPSGFFHQDGDFPRRLEPGEGCMALVRAPELANGLVREGYTGRVELRVAYRDKVGRVYESEPFEFHPEQWRANK